MSRSTFLAGRVTREGPALTCSVARNCGNSATAQFPRTAGKDATHRVRPRLAVLPTTRAAELARPHARPG